MRVAGAVGVLALPLLLELREAEPPSLPLALPGLEEVLQRPLEIRAGGGDGGVVALAEVLILLLEGRDKWNVPDFGPVLLPFPVRVLVPPEALVVHRAGTADEHAELPLLLVGRVYPVCLALKHEYQSFL